MSAVQQPDHDASETGAGLMATISQLEYVGRTLRTPASVRVVDERRGVMPMPEPSAPAVLCIDLGALAAQIAQEPDAPVVPTSALDLELLACARKCVAGDATQRPSRELIAVALREVRREQAFRDHAEKTAVELRGYLRDARRGRHDALALLFELVRFIAAEHGVEASATAVLEFVRGRTRTLDAAAQSAAGSRDATDGTGGGGAASDRDDRGVRRTVAGGPGDGDPSLHRA